MSRTVMDLLQEAGGDTEKTVATACNRWRGQLREYTLSLTGLQLRRQHGQKTEQSNLSFRIDPGLPEPLGFLESQEFPSNDKWAIELIGLSGQDIGRLQTACKNLSPLIKRLRDIPTWGNRAETYGGILAQTATIAEELAQYAAKAELLELIFQINQDVLGIYRSAPGDLWRSRGQIELYWLIIGAAARLMGVEVEGLAITVLAHEMAHAYTHLGTDLNGEWWENGFWECDHAIVEGIAQYYTHKALQLLVERRGNLNGWNAYNAMLAQQQKHGNTPYTNHIAWVDKYSLEVMRETLRDARIANHQFNLDSFVKLLDQNARRWQRHQSEH